MLFSELQCSKEILRALEDMGFEEATPIQSLAIPVVFEGSDIVGQAQTGTGKTAAFAIPMLQSIDTKSKTTQALILCPTRELAVQISGEIQKIGKYIKNLSILPVFGGSDIERQIRALRSGVHIVIGTPGRVLDHLRRKTLNLGHLKILTLDEADEMLNMGFREDIELVLDQVEHEIQTLLFSATMPKEILGIIDEYQRDPQILRVEHKALAAPSVTQVYLEMKEKDKVEILSRLVDMYNYKLSIVFCNTKKKVDEVCDALQARGYACDKIHGDMKQTLRLNVINKFKRGDIELLIATDVAARGLDIDNVEAVFNVDMPTHEEYYVHRIGRTGRAGREGISYTFITFREFHLLRSIMKYTKSDIKPHPIPKISDIAAMKREIFLEKVRERIDGGLDVKYVELIDRLTDMDYSVTEIAAALFQMNLDMPAATEIDSIDNSKEYGEERRKGKRDSDRGDDRRDRERGDRDRGERRSRSRGDMARIRLNVGKKEGAMPRDIVGALANETGISGSAIGDIRLFDHHAEVEIPQEAVSRVVERIEGCRIKNTVIVADLLPGAKSKGYSRGSAKGREPQRDRKTKKPKRRG